jgi:hypothetical protein
MNRLFLLPFFFFLLFAVCKSLLLQPNTKTELARDDATMGSFGGLFFFFVAKNRGGVLFFAIKSNNLRRREADVLGSADRCVTGATSDCFSNGRNRNNEFGKMRPEFRKE